MKTILFLLVVLGSTVNHTDDRRLINEVTTCPAPEDIVLFKNGGGPPVWDTVEPGTSYLIKLSTQASGYACITSSSGITFSGSGCNDVTSGGQYYSFYTITTNSSIPSGISITITSYCWNGSSYTPSGSNTFNFGS